MSILTPAGKPATRTISRRAFLTRSAAAAASLSLIPTAQTLAKTFGRERMLSFHNTNTGEEFSITCSPEEHYDASLLTHFNNFLRDHHANLVRDMDPGLIDLLYAISAFTGSTGTFQVLSGYRSPETNQMLKSQGHNVADHSFHIEGKAIDLRMTDVDIRTIQRVALALQQGGVGYYGRSNFVHVDTGPIRAW